VPGLSFPWGTRNRPPVTRRRAGRIRYGPSQLAARTARNHRCAAVVSASHGLDSPFHPATIRTPLGIGVTVARLALNQLVQVRILDPQLTHPAAGCDRRRSAFGGCARVIALATAERHRLPVAHCIEHHHRHRGTPPHTNTAGGELCRVRRPRDVHRVMQIGADVPPRHALTSRPLIEPTRLIALRVSTISFACSPSRV